MRRPLPHWPRETAITGITRPQIAQPALWLPPSKFPRSGETTVTLLDSSLTPNTVSKRQIQSLPPGLKIAVSIGPGRETTGQPRRPAELRTGNPIRAESASARSSRPTEAVSVDLDIWQTRRLDLARNRPRRIAQRPHGRRQLLPGGIVNQLDNLVSQARRLPKLDQKLIQPVEFVHYGVGIGRSPGHINVLA
jgi:hypothetical protein